VGVKTNTSDGREQTQFVLKIFSQIDGEWYGESFSFNPYEVESEDIDAIINKVSN